MPDPGKPTPRNSLRVLHIDTGRGWRGGQQQVYLLHREMIRRGLDSALAARSGGDLVARCRREVVPIAGEVGDRLWNPSGMIALRRLIRGADLVHAHDSHAISIVAAAGIGRRSPPVICHRRNAYPVRERLDRSWKYRRVVRWFAVTEEIAGILRAAGVDRRRIRVVHSVIDVDGFRSTAESSDLAKLRRELELPDGAPVVGTVGALVAQKGHRVLISAAPAVLAASPSALVVCVGEGPLRGSLEAAVAQNEVAGSFRFTGFRSDVAAVFRLIDVFVASSVDGEGSSAVIKEAMALGKAVVASDLGGNREVLGDAGLLVPVGDVGALGSAVVDLLSDPDRRAKLGERAAERVGGFRPTAMVDTIVTEYRQIVSRAQATEAR